MWQPGTEEQKKKADVQVVILLLFSIKFSELA